MLWHGGLGGFVGTHGGGILGVFVRLSWGCCGAILGLVWGCYRVVARQFREGLKSYREAKIRGQVRVYFCRDPAVSQFLPRGNDLPLSVHWVGKAANFDS